MAVLDVGHAVAVEEPRVELDPRLKVRVAIDVAAQDLAEVGLDVVPVQLDVVVAMDERERMTGGHERGERGEHLGVTLGDAAQLEARVVRGAAEAVVSFFVGERRVHHRVGPDGHANEVDEVARDDQPPA